RLFPSGLRQAEYAGSGPTGMVNRSSPVRVSHTDTQPFDPLSPLAIASQWPSALYATLDIVPVAFVMNGATSFPVSTSWIRTRSSRLYAPLTEAIRRPSG